MSYGVERLAEVKGDDHDVWVGSQKVGNSVVVPSRQVSIFTVTSLFYLVPSS